MCGIIALYDTNRQTGASRVHTRAVIERMQATLAKRGPDEAGVADLGPCWLAHTRLSIIDLATGTQPVYNEDGTIAVVLNGEIYNYPELRASLARNGHVFRTTSDTEVIVHLYEDHGERFLEHLNGMFAIVLYDRKSDTLIVARDRLGEKPVLYAQTTDSLVVASELKALAEHPGIGRDVDPDAIALYLSSSYVPAPYSIFKSVRKLPPAHYLKAQGSHLAIRQYWRPSLVAVRDRTEQDTCERFIELFADAIRMRMVADVPLGVFLSGGIDSSAVTAFMARAAGTVKTFTVGFPGDIDERPFARQVADRYRTEHTEIILRTDLDAAVDEIFTYMDEPFGDSSIVPTYVVSREARKHVKVILTGDGGDELFAGYTAYLDQRSQRPGRIATRAMRTAHACLDGTALSGLLNATYPQHSSARARAHWLGMRTVFDDREINAVMTRPVAGPSAFFGAEPWLPFTDRDPLSLAFEIDVNHYLPDDLLKKVDMASMCASLECRAPFLDHRVVEYAFSIPSLLKVHGGQPKHLLKRALAPYLPSAVLHRAKTGFGAPVPTWVRHRLRTQILDLLKAGALIEAFLDRKTVAEIVSRCFRPDNESDWGAAYRVWLLFVLERWMNSYGRSNGASRQIA